jgi:hypothetical protein
MRERYAAAILLASRFGCNGGRMPPRFCNPSRDDMVRLQCRIDADRRA